MKCRECHQGRRFAEGSIWCRIYGMIIREDHECTREGWKIHDDDDQRGEGDDETAIPSDGGGAAGAGEGILSGS